MKKKKLVSMFLVPLTFLIFGTSIALAANSIWYATWFPRISCNLYNSSSSGKNASVRYEACHITSGATRTYYSANVYVPSRTNKFTSRNDNTTIAWMKRFVVPTSNISINNLGQSY